MAAGPPCVETNWNLMGYRGGRKTTKIMVGNTISNNSRYRILYIPSNPFNKCPPCRPVRDGAGTNAITKVTLITNIYIMSNKS